MSDKQESNKRYYQKNKIRLVKYQKEYYKKLVFENAI
jgi:hypothetical protein